MKTTYTQSGVPLEMASRLYPVLAAQLESLLLTARKDVIIFAFRDYETAKQTQNLVMYHLQSLDVNTTRGALKVGDRYRRLSAKRSAFKSVNSMVTSIPFPDHMQRATLHDRVNYLFTIYTLMDRYRDMRSVLRVCHNLRVHIQRGA
jgi:hypothetical protein